MPPRTIATPEQVAEQLAAQGTAVDNNVKEKRTRAQRRAQTAMSNAETSAFIVQQIIRATDRVRRTNHQR